MKGQNLRILIEDKCVAFATACTYHLSANLEDSSTKDDAGSFQKQDVTGFAGDISCDALFSVVTDATGNTGVDLIDTLLAGTEVDVEFSQTNGANNRTATGVKYACKAIVNDISVNAPNRANVTYTIQMQMNSKPTKSGTPSGDETTTTS